MSSYPLKVLGLGLLEVVAVAAVQSLYLVRDQPSAVQPVAVALNHLLQNLLNIEKSTHFNRMQRERLELNGKYILENLYSDTPLGFVFLSENSEWMEKSFVMQKILTLIKLR